MRIGIDIRDLVSGLVGVGSTILKLLEYLDRNVDAREYVLYQKTFNEYCKGPRFRQQLTRIPVYNFPVEQVYFSGRLTFDRLDVFHAPIHLPPLCAPRSTKIVMSIHDLHVEKYPELYPKSMWRYFVPHRKQAMQQAQALIAHTESVKHDIVEYAGIAPDKITVIPLAPKEEFYGKRSVQEYTIAKEKYRLPERFVIYVGSVERWKRVSFLIESIAQYRRESNDPIHCVIVGRPGGDSNECNRVMQATRDHEWVHWLGYVPQSDLPTLCQLATLFCSASVCEGFGLIFLEAMASGLPVVAARSCAIPETVGEGGVLFDSENSEDCVRCLSALLQDPSLYAHVKRQAEQRARQFSWTQYGSTISALYDRVLLH